MSDLKDSPVASSRPLGQLQKRPNDQTLNASDMVQQLVAAGKSQMLSVMLIMVALCNRADHYISAL